MRILVLNGPNLNLLQKRNADIYGKLSLEKIEQVFKDEFTEHDFTFVQSNIEGELIDHIQKADEKFDGLIINPGGYAHSSVALRDALDICKIIKIEVHLSNLASREEFRQKMITASACDGYISGFKENSYIAAVHLLVKIFSTK